MDDLLVKIQNVCKELDEIEDYCDSLPSKLSNCDLKLSDIEHYIESSKPVANERYHLISKMQEVLKERRKVKNDMELSRTYKTNDKKLLIKGNRQMLLSELNKTNGRLNQPYKYRVFTTEELSVKKEVL